MTATANCGEDGSTSYEEIAFPLPQLRRDDFFARRGPLHAHPVPKAPAQKISSVRVTIEVTGGEKDAPIENASVYLKYVEERKIAKDKQIELNVKTNRDGIAHVPDAPLGRVLIQIVAEGWKTFGRWYDVSDSKQPIKIHLDRPPRWY